MGERFAIVTEEETYLFVHKVEPENIEKSTSHAVNVFDGKHFVPRAANYI